jgi:hypothetical protein
MPAPEDRDLLIELRTMVRQVLDRLDRGDQRFDSMDQRLRAVEGDVAVIKSTSASGSDVAVINATTAQHVGDTRHRQVVMWTAITALGGLALVLVTVVVELANRKP